MTEDERIAKEKEDVLQLAAAMSTMQAALNRIRLLEQQLKIADNAFDLLQRNLGEKLMIEWYRDGGWKSTYLHKAIQDTRDNIKKVLP
jgi:hypothetical protein